MRRRNKPNFRTIKLRWQALKNKIISNLFESQIGERVITKQGMISLVCVMFSIAIPFLGIHYKTPFEFNMTVMLAFVLISIVNSIFPERVDN